MTRAELRDLEHLALALVASRMSTCLRRSVGCCLAGERHRTVYLGYNGPAAGTANACLRPGDDGGCGCLHAELNACLKVGAGAGPLAAYLTDSPCEGCASAMANAGVRRVLWLRERSAWPAGRAVLDAAGIQWDRAEEGAARRELRDRFGVTIEVD